MLDVWPLVHIHLIGFFVCGPKVHDLLKLYNEINVPAERLLFKIPSTWQVNSDFLNRTDRNIDCENST